MYLLYYVDVGYRCSFIVKARSTKGTIQHMFTGYRCSSMSRQPRYSLRMHGTNPVKSHGAYTLTRVTCDSVIVHWFNTHITCQHPLTYGMKSTWCCRREPDLMSSKVRRSYWRRRPLSHYCRNWCHNSWVDLWSPERTCPLWHSQKKSMVHNDEFVKTMLLHVFVYLNIRLDGEFKANFNFLIMEQALDCNLTPYNND